jgi:hypothetical protein
MAYTDMNIRDHERRIHNLELRIKWLERVIVVLCENVDVNVAAATMLATLRDERYGLDAT